MTFRCLEKGSLQRRANLLQKCYKQNVGAKKISEQSNYSNLKLNTMIGGCKSHDEQRDQIGLLWKGLGDKYSHKSSQNIWKPLKLKNIAF